MREYLRREKISFKYMPAFWLLRLFFCISLLFSGYAQWCVMIIASYFSIGFIYGTEMENMLPLTDEEIRSQRFLRVRVIWIRYFILGVISLLINYYLIKKGTDSRVNTPVVIMHFILQMISVYDTFLDAITRSGRNNRFFDSISHKGITKYITETIPLLVFFIYGYLILIMTSQINANIWIHVSVLGISSILLGINAILKSKAWRISDYEH